MTELGQIPKEWETVRLGDAVQTIKGRKPDSLVNLPEKDSIPYLTADYFRTLVPSSFVKPLSASLLVTVGESDVVFIWDGSNAGDVFTGLKGVVASTMVKIFPKLPDLESKFLYFYLKTQFNLFNTTTTGSTIPHVNKQLFQNLTLPLPPLPEQKAIAGVLSTVQKAIEAQDKIIAAARELKKSIIRHLFAYGPVPVAEAENVPLKETEIGPVPEHWEVVRLGKIADIRYGKAKPKTEGSVPVVGSGGIYARTDSPLIDFPTLIIGRKGTAGEVWLFKEPCWPSDTTFYLVWKQELSIKYIFGFLSTHKLSGEHAKTTLPSLQKHELENSLLPIATITEQREIARILSTVDIKTESEENRKEALQVLFKTMLHQLMTGKVRVKDLEATAT